MYKDILNPSTMKREKRNLRERNYSTMQRCPLLPSLDWEKNVSDLTLEDAESFLTAKRLEGKVS